MTNKAKYDEFAWFEEIEAAAHKEIATYNQVQSWAKPAPVRATKPVGVVAQLVSWLSSGTTESRGPK